MDRAKIRNSLSQIGELVCARRTMRGWGRDRLAEVAGVAPEIVERVEDGDPGVSAGHLVAILDRVGLLESYIAYIAEKDDVTRA